MMVLRKMMELATPERDKTTTWLLIGSIYFAMRSCEYLKTALEESKHTKIICIGNIIFKKGNRILNHADPELEKADLVRVRFIFQKNDKQDMQVHMKSGNNLLCPVIAWATTVRQVRKIPLSSDNSEVCLFLDSWNRVTLLHSSHIRIKLRAIVILIGKDILGFDKEDTGLHSIRSIGAMAML